METAIIILIQNGAPLNQLEEFKHYIAKYLGLSRYCSDNDNEEGMQNAVNVEGTLSDKEKDHLMHFNKDIYLFFVECDEDPFDDNNTIKITNETNS